MSNFLSINVRFHKSFNDRYLHSFWKKFKNNSIIHSIPGHVFNWQNYHPILIKVIHFHKLFEISFYLCEVVHIGQISHMFDLCVHMWDWARCFPLAIIEGKCASAHTGVVFVGLFGRFLTVFWVCLLLFLFYLFFLWRRFCRQKPPI